MYNSVIPLVIIAVMWVSFAAHEWLVKLAQSKKLEDFEIRAFSRRAKYSRWCKRVGYISALLLSINTILQVI